ncbi:hypothetical protein [Chromobacterium sp. IIBBL 290-4]|uniref:hypothetical protein n=1 Tax=Chromobacterium sp. IIBBL 290-4 TaxID=2953890 RepID=UPI0020B8DE0E|nr:hypothetical protein [Chromobacterium sp. IIBBL 290-4]UTH75087.1 hypothetical protein NKT35_03010 [Chromobacterium sp. IIBBL 290-4]
MQQSEQGKAMVQTMMELSETELELTVGGSGPRSSAAEQEWSLWDSVTNYFTGWSRFDHFIHNTP